MNIIALSLGLLALVLQMQASAWHRALMTIASDSSPSGIKAHRAEYVLLQPSYVKFRSGFAGILMLASSTTVAVIGEWWWGLILYFGLVIAANVLSRLLLPGARNDYWSQRVLAHAEESLYASIIAGDTPKAERFAMTVSELRYSMGLGNDSAATIIEDSYREVLKKLGTDEKRQ